MEKLLNTGKKMVLSTLGNAMEILTTRIGTADVP